MADLQKLDKTIKDLELNSQHLESYKNLYDELKQLKEELNKMFGNMQKNNQDFNSTAALLEGKLKDINKNLLAALSTNEKNQNQIKKTLSDISKQNKEFKSELELMKEKKKIVCSMMNDFYGFGHFRNKIWLRHSEQLDPAYQIGYHILFLPLVNFAKGPNLRHQFVRFTLEHIAKHRTIDIWMNKNNKIHFIGKLYRIFLEPLCYVVGKIHSKHN